MSSSRGTFEIPVDATALATFPEGMTFTHMRDPGDDEKQRRRMKRLERNKRAAQHSRQKKKAFLEQQQQSIEGLQKEISFLKKQLEDTQAENAQLRRMLSGREKG